jgi:hypothetical protein
MKRQMQNTISRKWSDASGDRTHKLTTIVEFEGCNFVTLAIVSEEGRPPFAADPLETTGAVAANFINNPAMLKALGFTPIAAA